MTTSVTRQTAENGRVACLDGLRGLAVTAVVAFHFITSGMLIPTGGYLGVPVFFMLSGYLITGMLWTSHQPPGWSTYRRFVARRLQRLAPAHLALILIATPGAVLVGMNWGEAVKGALASATQTMSLYLGLVQPQQGPLDPTWSLSVEWWFYLLWPVALLWAKRRAWTAPRVRNAAIFLSIALYASAIGLPGESFYFLPWPNLAVLLGGAAVALQRQHRSTSTTAGSSTLAVNTALALLLVLLVAPSGMFAPGYRLAVLPCTVAVTALLLNANTAEAGLAIRILSHPALRFLGVRAYSIYLWHLALLWLVFNAAGSASRPAVVAIALSALVPVVWASYRFLERPWLSGTLKGPDARSERRVHSEAFELEKAVTHPG